MVNAKLAVADITSGITGILGEHIADYYCYEKLHWGMGWIGHDQGYLGRWSSQPGAETLGKLNDHGKLNKLFDLRPRGHGIDGVWRARPETNDGKPFAIVEAKSSKVDKPMKSPDGKRSMASKLGTAGSRVKDVVRPDAEELLEPPATGASATSAGSGKPGGAKQPPGKRTPTSSDAVGEADAGPEGSGKTAMIQMSDAWIKKNLLEAVGDSLSEEIRLQGYSRHILYVPFYLPCAVEHEVAFIKGDEHGHHDHDIPHTHHYNDQEVAAAVKRKELLMSKRN